MKNSVTTSTEAGKRRCCQRHQRAAGVEGEGEEQAGQTVGREAQGNASGRQSTRSRYPPSREGPAATAGRDTGGQRAR